MMLSFLTACPGLFLHDPAHVETRHPVLVGGEIDHALTGGAFSPGGKPGVVAGSFFHQLADGPAFPPVCAYLNGDVIAFVPTPR